VVQRQYKQYIEIPVYNAENTIGKPLRAAPLLAFLFAGIDFCFGMVSVIERIINPDLPQGCILVRFYGSDLRFSVEPHRAVRRIHGEIIPLAKQKTSIYDTASISWGKMKTNSNGYSCHA